MSAVKQIKIIRGLNGADGRTPTRPVRLGVGPSRFPWARLATDALHYYNDDGLSVSFGGVL